MTLKRTESLSVDTAIACLTAPAAPDPSTRLPNRPTESHLPGPRLSSPACCPADPAPAPLPRTATGPIYRNRARTVASHGPHPLFQPQGRSASVDSGLAADGGQAAPCSNPPRARRETLGVGWLSRRQARLGHASIQTTVDTYGHVLPASDAEAGEALEAAIVAAK